MQHLDEGTIHSWLDGALSTDEASRVAAHVAECLQCAAAVAEARGFIAASSRILTALDHVPRGVVPAAPAVKWHNRAVWRAAAAVLVVAVGSLVVVRNSEHSPAVAPTMIDSAGAPQATVTPPQIAAASPGPKVTRKPQVPGRVTPSTQSATTSSVEPSGKPTAEADFSAARSKVAGAMVTAPQPALSSRVAGVTMMDAATEQPPLKVVGTPRMIGAKVTLYEVAPGDTVTLTEALKVQVNAVVVSGASPAESQARRSVEKSAATATARRSDTVAVAAPDSLGPQVMLRGRTTPASAAEPPLQVEVVNGVTTISWPDLTTGNMLKLSGHIPVERLKEIKLRIERERAAAAAKKGP